MATPQEEHAQAVAAADEIVRLLRPMKDKQRAWALCTAMVELMDVDRLIVTRVAALFEQLID